MKDQLVRSLRVAVLLAAFSVLASCLLAAPQENAKPSPEVMRYIEEGSAHYLKHEFKEAIVPYAKALALEQQRPTLDKTLWRVLIDNLGMAYGISGDLKKAKETFEFGLSRDKVYPMFYYNLACTYAEMNDMDASIVNLKLAFTHKADVIAGEQMPDPAQDDSFQRFLKNPRFVSALSDIRESPATGTGGTEPDRIVITGKPDGYEMTVPVSRLVMTIPREGFLQASRPRAEATASRRYFYLEDTTQHLFLSGWFEAQSGFPGMNKFWEGETAAWSRNNLPKPEHVVFKKIGGWDAISYRIPIALRGSNAHLRAHWLAAGTWIDIHLSIASDATEAENQNSLEALLARIKVTEKPQP